MVDAFRTETVERSGDVGGRPLFTGVRYRVEAGIACELVGLGEPLGWVPNLGRVEADPDHQVRVRLRLRPRFKRCFSGEVAEETHNQRGGDTPFLGCRVDGACEAAHEHGEVDAPFGVGLRVEEDLGSADSVGGGSPQIGIHEVEEVLLGHQDGRTLVVDVEERLQIGELVCRTHLLDVRERQVDAVAGGEVKHHLRLEGPLDVEMELGFRHGADERCSIHAPIQPAHRTASELPTARRSVAAICAR